METPSIAAGNVHVPDGHVSNNSQAIHQLRRACMSNDLSTVTSLLEQGVNANAGGEVGMSALHLACGLGHLSIVQALLSYHGTNTTKSPKGMMIPASYGMQDRGVTDIAASKEAGRVNLDATDSAGQTALHVAACGGRTEIVAEFIRTISDSRLFDKQDHDGWTPLMSATQGQHAATVERLLAKSRICIADKTGNTPLMVAMQNEDLPIVELLWRHLCETNSPDLSMTDSLLIWGSEKYKRHQLVEIILSRNDQNGDETVPLSAIERATRLRKPELLWWLIATSPHDHATKCIKKAQTQIQTFPNIQRTATNEERKIMETQLPTKSQQIASVPTRDQAFEAALPEIRDILQNPPFEVAYEDDPFQDVPDPGELAKKYDAHIRGFFRTGSTSSTICKTLTVDDVVYQKGPVDMMKQRIQTEKRYMERGQQASITSDMYNKGNSQFTWVHLPATRIDWMEHLAQKIALTETGLVKDRYSEIKSFLKGSWFQIPDQRTKSRIMRPGFSQRTFGGTANVEDGISHKPDPKVDGHESSLLKPNMTDGEDPITCSAIYMPFLSFSTHLVEPTLKKALDELPEHTRHGKYLINRFNTARLKYDSLMPKSNVNSSGHPIGHPPVHPVVHGCPTLDEAFYHFAGDDASQKEKQLRNHSQVVSKESTTPTDSKDKKPHTQTILRVSQIWIWTIGDRWIISASSHPVDDVEELWIHGFIDHLQKDARARGALSQPSSSQEMIRKMATYCIGSYERRRTYEKLDSTPNQKTNKKNGDLTHGLSTRQLFWDYINQTGRKETSLFEENRTLMKKYRGKYNKELRTDGGRNLVESVKEAILKAQELFSEVKDVRDELGILQWVVSCQDTVQKKLPKANKDTSELTVKYVMNDINRMELLASRIQENTNSTLSLLQNEIATLETEEALNQGRVFMVFTVLTIVFLPMSFLTSLFAMEANQLVTQPGWSFGVIFGAGVIVTVPSIIFTWPWTIDWLMSIFKRSNDCNEIASKAGIHAADGDTTSSKFVTATESAPLTPTNRKISRKSYRDLEMGGASQM